MYTEMKIARIPVIQRGDLIIDPQCCTVILNGMEIGLYPKEFDVLYLLTQYPGWVLSTEQIYRNVWKEDMTGNEHVVYNIICQLRKKLKNPAVIQTVKDHGYKFVG